jgi:hypothetical protein
MGAYNNNETSPTHDGMGTNDDGGRMGITGNDEGQGPKRRLYVVWAQRSFFFFFFYSFLIHFLNWGATAVTTTQHPPHRCEPLLAGWITGANGHVTSNNDETRQTTELPPTTTPQPLPLPPRLRASARRVDWDRGWNRTPTPT